MPEDSVCKVLVAIRVGPIFGSVNINIGEIPAEHLICTEEGKSLILARSEHCW
jgi:hypothetical protein